MTRRYVPFQPSIDIQRVDMVCENMIDFEFINDEFNTRFKKSFKKIGIEAKEFWKSEAGRRLKASREAYQNSIVVSHETDAGIQIVLGKKGNKKDRWLAVVVENGMPSYA